MIFELDEYHRNTPSENMITDVKNVARKLNKQTVTIAEYKQHGKYHPSTLQRKFGSWFKVLEIANLEDSRSRLFNSEEELFRNIEEIWIKLGRQPRYHEVQKPISKYHASTYTKRFGSWRKALESFISYVNTDSAEEGHIDNARVDKAVAQYNEDTYKS